jgi:DNA-cytosine methyltransferase
MNGINVLSLFGGIECGLVALKKLGIKINKYYSSEIDKYAIQIANKNHPEIVQLGDITKWLEWDIDWSSIGLLIAGSPRQGFSFMGKQLNFNDERSKLFFVYAEILEHIKSVNPSVVFLLENVKMKKEYQDVITSYLGVEPIEINSALVSAQNRKRLYWTNITGITQPKDKGIFLPDILFDDAILPVVHNIYGGFKETKPRIFADKSPTIRTAAGGGHIPSVVMGKSWHEWWEKNKQFQLDKKYSSLDADKAITMLARQYASWTGNFVSWKEFIRKFHPIECERLQTLPDNYTAGISDTQRYKCIGNGWTVDVIVHILSHMKIRQVAKQDYCQIAI